MLRDKVIALLAISLLVSCKKPAAPSVMPPILPPEAAAGTAPRKLGDANFGPKPGGGGSGTVTSVTASSPLASSGGTTPNITSPGLLTAAQVVSVANLTLSGEQTIDGVLTSASRVLVAGQSTASQNGVYTTGAGAWTRTADFTLAAQMLSGAFVPIIAGTQYAGSGWVFTTTGAITVGTTALTFLQINGLPSFGPNTTISQLNGSGISKPTYNFVNDYTVNTNGSETSEVVEKLMSAGTQTTVSTLTPSTLTLVPRILAPSGSSSLPGYSFSAAPADGYYRQGLQDYRFIVAGSDVFQLGASGPVMPAATTPITWTSSGSTIAGGGANNRNLILVAGNSGIAYGDVVLGDLVTNATTAQNNFVDLPTVSGTPTGVPNQTATGHAPCELDIANFKVCCYMSSAWKCTATMN